MIVITFALFVSILNLITIVDLGVLSITSRSIRADQDPFYNDFKPSIKINVDENETYMNNITLRLNITVWDADEWLNQTWNAGTHIDSVIVNFQSISGGKEIEMNYMGDSQLPYCNSSRGEGVYIYDLDLNGVEPGNYAIELNATDSGDNMTGYNAKNATVQFTLKVGQFNRPPSYIGPGALETSITEDEFNTEPYELDLTTLFTDDDVTGNIVISK